MIKQFQDSSKKERYVFFGIIAGLFILAGIVFYPSINGFLGNKITGNSVMAGHSDKPMSPQEYYAMFKCPCCGKSIETNCCGMAKERRDYVDQLLLEGINEDEVVYKMVKKFGFGSLMDPSKEQEVKEYAKTKAPDRPPKIEVENPKYDFGRISHLNGNVSTTFTIKNTGDID